MRDHAAQGEGNARLERMQPHDGEITGLLVRLNQGSKAAEALLMPLVYAELRKIARNHLRREAAGHSLQPSALVHEAYLKFVGIEDLSWQNRGHFFAVAANLMRHVLVDHARSRLAAKRGGALEVLPLEEAMVAAPGHDASRIDMIALHNALEELEALDARQAKVVDLRFFGGLSDEEASRILGVSERTVKRDWRVARAFLYQALYGNTSPS